MAKKEKKYYFGIEHDSMTVVEYMKQINDIAIYYFDKCEKYKRRFYYACFTRIIATALIPVISLAAEVNWSSVIVSILAGVIAITEGYVNVTRAYEKWTKYRETCNALWFEQRQYAFKIGKYSDDKTRTQIFAEQCENIMLAESNEWKKYIDRAKDMK